MQLLLWIIVILAAYFFLVFVGTRLVIPYYGFKQFSLPKEIPAEIKNKITELELQNPSAEGYLRAAYSFVISRWYAGRGDTVYRAPLAFRKNLLQIWQSPGYAHCHTQDYVLFVLLAGSKFFKPEDIQTRYVFFNFFTHQYIKVRVGEKCVDVDPAGASIRGMPLGKHIAWFG